VRGREESEGKGRQEREGETEGRRGGLVEFGRGRADETVKTLDCTVQTAAAAARSGRRRLGYLLRQRCFHL